MKIPKVSVSGVAQVFFAGVILVFVLWIGLMIAAVIKSNLQLEAVKEQLQIDISVAMCRNAAISAELASGSINFAKSDWHDKVTARCTAQAEYEHSFRADLLKFWEHQKTMVRFLFE